VCLLVGSFGLSLTLARNARATEEASAPPSNRGVTALVTGIGTAGASLAYGGFLLTSGNSLSAKHDGIYVMSLGLTLAPFVAHGVADEWARGALFSIVPAIGGIGMAMLLAKRPDAPIRGKQESQKIYPVFITISTVGSAIGIFDAALADERLPKVGVALGDKYAGAAVSGQF
jgi:hypothetical protein